MYPLLRPLIFALDAETAHRLTVSALRLLPPGQPADADPILASTVAGLTFPGPVGLAAGFDKDGLVADRMHRFGFGFAELGTLTPLPQPGNPRPRLFRLAEDRAVINRMGFNNRGQTDAARRIAGMQRAGRIIGINIGANKDATDRIADYATGVRTMAPLADYLTVNISSPNTPGLRALQGREALDELLGAVMDARGERGTPCPAPTAGPRLAAPPRSAPTAGPRPAAPPIFLKVAPDLEPSDIDDIARCVTDHHVDALIVSNTTIGRPALHSRFAAEIGGLSGAPLHDLSLARLRDFRAALGSSVPLIGAGGIATAEQAYTRIRAGASLVQIYSAMVFEGPWLAERINRGLKVLLRRDGLATIAEAVGLDARN